MMSLIHLFANFCGGSISLQIVTMDPFVTILCYRALLYISMEIITNTNTRGSNFSKLLLMVGMVSFKSSLGSSLENLEAVVFDNVRVNVTDPWHPTYTGFTEILNINAKK